MITTSSGEKQVTRNSSSFKKIPAQTDVHSDQATANKLKKTVTDIKKKSEEKQSIMGEEDKCLKAPALGDVGPDKSVRPVRKRREPVYLKDYYKP